MADRCAAGERCSGFDHREHVAAEVDLGKLLCEPDLCAGERAVPALVLDYRDLEQHLPPSLGVWGDGQPASKDPHRVPLNLAAESLQAEIHWVVTTWEEVVRDRERLSDSVTKHRRDGWAVQEAAKILRPRVRLLSLIGPITLASYPEVDDEHSARLGGMTYADIPGWQGVLDFIELHRRAQRLLGLTRVEPERCEGVVCRECDMLALYRVPGEDRVLCGSCRLSYTAEEYKNWVGISAADAKRRYVA